MNKQTNRKNKDGEAIKDINLDGLLESAQNDEVYISLKSQNREFIAQVGTIIYVAKNCYKNEPKDVIEDYYNNPCNVLLKDNYLAASL